MWLKWMAAPRLELGMRIITQSVYLPRPSVRQAIHLRSASVSPPKIAFLPPAVLRTRSRQRLWSVRPRPWDGWNVMGEPTKADNN